MQNKLSNRSGIALVMVLGVLSLMVLLAVSFAIAMRTERVAAGNYLDAAKARQLAQVGLARSLEQLQDLCGTNLSDLNLVYPPWVITNSYDPDTPTDVKADLVKGSVSNFIPGALWDAATNASKLDASNHWLYISSETTGMSNLIGRVAYLIVNCSGLLDASFVGGVERGAGTNPLEIAVETLPNVSSNFVAQRIDHVRYETQEELNALQSFDPPTENLFVYSRSPAGYWSNNVLPQINLAGDVAVCQNREEDIIEAFKKASFKEDEPGLLFTNLLHYLDPAAANGPRNYGGVAVDDCFRNAYAAPVAMINELAFQSTVLVEAVDDPEEGVNQYGVSSTVSLELWNPFLTSQHQTYTVKIQGELYSDPSGFLEAVPVIVASNLWVDVGGFAVLEHTVTAHGESAPGDSVRIGVRDLNVTVEAGGSVADKLTTPCGQGQLEVACELLSGEGESSASGPVSLECIDPRFNWDPTDAGQWVLLEDDATLGEINHATREYWDANLDCDQTPEMYTRCGAPLDSVGELGYLVYAPWRTVKLYGADESQILDFFILDADGTTNFLSSEFIRHGLVNINSTNQDILASVFNNLPLDAYPGEKRGEKIIPQNVSLDNLGDVIIRPRKAGEAAEYGFTNLSDVWRCPDWKKFFEDNPTVAATNKFQREALVRNSIGLLTTRDQVYTIIIEAHLASSGNIPRRPSRQRAVAVVWRDAWTGDMLVRYFKWLPD